MARCNVDGSIDEDRLFIEKTREKLAKTFSPEDEGRFKEGKYTVFYKGVTKKEWDEWKSFCDFNDALKEIKMSLVFWKDEIDAFLVGSDWTVDPQSEETTFFFAVFKDIEKKTHEIKGIIRGNTIYVDGIKINPDKSLRIRDHSPDGFNWGYQGSGPAQAALGILVEIVPERIATRIYQHLHFDVISQLKRDKDFEFNVNVEPDKITVLKSKDVPKDIVINFK